MKILSGKCPVSDEQRFERKAAEVKEIREILKYFLEPVLGMT